MQIKHQDNCCAVNLENAEGKNLKTVLFLVFFINFGMFFVEAVSGLTARSNALLADSLDMLGDAFVYGISIAVLSKHPSVRAKGSLVKGAVMLGLGLLVVGQSILKIINPIVPVAETITVIGSLALLANAASFALLLKHKAKDLNVRSAWICSRNDVVANIGVIIAGLLVARFNSIWPDITAGLIIAFIVIRSAVQIIKEAWKHMNLKELAVE
ncbi:MAG: cation diffusion facilitator family transporter [Candidatus Taylorbacteria bacterium]|nr:cation diffusion facilitator family transporter [Candidatus Taylorbacteria bacterium]